jgi:peroxiredoxin
MPAPTGEGPLTAKLTLVNRGRTPVRLLSAETALPNLEIDVNTNGPGGTQQVTVLFPADYEVPRGPEAKLMVTTDDKQYASIRVPVFRAPLPRPPRTPVTNVESAAEFLGKIAPSFTIKTLSGRTFSNQSLQGKVTVVAFLLPANTYSHAQLPVLEHTWANVRDKNVEVVAVFRGGSSEDAVEDARHVERIRSRTGATFPMAIDPDGRVAKLFRVGHWPTVFVFGKKANLEAMHLGLQSDMADLLDQHVTLLLGNRTHEAFPEAAPAIPPPGPHVRSHKAATRPVGSRGPARDKGLPLDRLQPPKDAGNRTKSPTSRPSEPTSRPAR